MGRSKRRRGYGGGNSGQPNGGKANKPQVKPIESDRKLPRPPLSIYCGVCGKAHDDGFSLWRLPRCRQFNTIVEIPTCRDCMDSHHFEDFLGLDGDSGPKTTSDFLTFVARYIELNQKRRNF